MRILEIINIYFFKEFKDSLESFNSLGKAVIKLKGEYELYHPLQHL